jgi:hypothetical protein
VQDVARGGEAFSTQVRQRAAHFAQRRGVAAFASRAWD